MQELANFLYPIWVALFMGIFIGIAVWAFWPSERRKKSMEDHASIPLRDDASPENGG